ncbi:MAG: EAL domain-containing protein, partial [Acidimicrobiales bacterium]
PAAEQVEDLIGLAPADQRSALRNHLHQTGTGQAAPFELTKRDGDSGWFDLRVSDLITDELVRGRVITVRDITIETRLRLELEHQASTDALTGLPNRRVLQPRLGDARSAMEHTGQPMALMTLDIDGFKTINDSLGHPVGDALLTQVAARLTNAIQPGQTILRMGGDEFAIILPSIAGEAAARLAAQHLLDTLDEPFQIGARLEHVRTSIGVALTDDRDHAEALIGRADIALYEAKRQGGDTVVIYEAELESTTTRHNQITRALREADYDREFSLVYQPIVTAEDQTIVSLEALLRWTSPHLGAIGPDEFIPIAEVTGEICGIGKWVLDEACRQLAAWIEAGVDPDITVSFNVSARQLAEPAFVAGVLETARRWNVPTNRLVAEITESAALDHTGVAQQRIQRLRDAGLRISIDDFGSGYSNLGQLISVPFDIIKIDRSLLLTLSAMREQAGGDETDSCAIMQAIVSIAGILDAPVVCEGVETEQQLISLHASGITHIQGYLTGRPALPALLTPQLMELQPAQA